MFRFVISVCLSLVAVQAQADSLEPVSDQGRFKALVADKTLTALGVSLFVSPNGEIEGRAFGKKVTGEWTWQGGYFCRDLTFGKQALDFNCQQVSVAGDRIRFTSDYGQGQSANLKLK